MGSASNIPLYLWFFFSPSVLMISWFAISIPYVVSFLPTFYYKHDKFFNVKFYSHILIIYYYLYKGLQFSFIFCKYLDIIHVYKLNKFFFWFCKFVASRDLSKNIIQLHHSYNK